MPIQIWTREQNLGVILCIYNIIIVSPIQYSCTCAIRHEHSAITPTHSIGQPHLLHGNTADCPAKCFGGRSSSSVESRKAYRTAYFIRLWPRNHVSPYFCSLRVTNSLRDLRSMTPLSLWSMYLLFSEDLIARWLDSWDMGLLSRPPVCFSPDVSWGVTSFRA